MAEAIVRFSVLSSNLDHMLTHQPQKGALTGKYPGTKREENVEKRQILTGLENIIAQAASDEAPPDRSGFFGINI